MRTRTELQEKVCPVCGKTFIPAPLHVYRDARFDKSVKHALVCSWRCVCESERLKGGDGRKKRRYTHSVEFECEDGFRGSASEVAEHLNIEVSTVYAKGSKGELKKCKASDNKKEKVSNEN